MGHIVSIVNQKGGVGKTTTAVNLAASLAVMEKRVLLIDTDPQANATSGVGIAPKSEQMSIYECIIDDKDPREALIKTELPHLDIITSNIDLIGAEIEMVSIPNREVKLKTALEKIKDDYDFIFIDCSPSLGLVTVNALTASNYVIIPVQAEYYALEGLGKLLNTVKIIQSGLNPNLSILGMLVTIFDPRLRLANEVLEEVGRHFEDLIFETVIVRNTRLAEAPGHGKPIVLYDVKSKGAQNYLDVAQEVIKRTKQ